MALGAAGAMAAGLWLVMPRRLDPGLYSTRGAEGEAGVELSIDGARCLSSAIGKSACKSSLAARIVYRIDPGMPQGHLTVLVVNRSGADRVYDGALRLRTDCPGDLCVLDDQTLSLRPGQVVHAFLSRAPLSGNTLADVRAALERDAAGIEYSFRVE